MKKLLIGGALVIMLGVGIASCDDDTTTIETEGNTTPVEEAVATEPVEEVEVDEKEPETTKYKAGTYKVGTDIPAGEYKVFANSKGQGLYFAVNDGAVGSGDIITNTYIENQAYTVLNDGEYFELTNGYAVPIEEATAYTGDRYESGIYKVGFDIPAGEHRVTASSSESIYAAIYGDSTGRSILSNTYTDGATYVSVQDGQYLEIQNGYIEK